MNKLASATYNLAFARRLADQFAAALAPAHEALALFARLGEESGRAVAKEILAESYLGLGQLNEAEDYAHQVIAEERTSTLPDGLRTLGEIRLRQGKLDEAERLIRQSCDIAISNQDQALEGYAWRALGEVHFVQQAYEKAQSCWTTAESLFAQCGMPEEVEKTRAISQQRSSL